jgi:hypothetical protein
MTRVFFLEARHDPVDGLVEVHHLDRRLALPGGQQGRLVHEIGQVGPDEPRSLGGNSRQVDGGREGDRLGVDSQDLLSALQIRAVERHVAIEPPGAEQGGVQDLRPIGGRQDDHALLGVEAVHLGEELVQGLLPLVVAAEHAADAPRLPESVELIDEDDARGLLLRLGEKVPDPCRPDADEHLDEVGPAQAEERRPGRSRSGAPPCGLLEIRDLLPGRETLQTFGLELPRDRSRAKADVGRLPHPSLLLAVRHFWLFV